jgi:RNA polymerase sigma-70 factor (ECF subfamily)
MLGLLQRYLRDRDEARDLLQDGFLKVFQRLESFDFQCPLDAWIRRIMVNTAIDRYRKDCLAPVTVEVEAAYDLGEEETIISEMSRQELLHAIQSLPHGYRVVFNMYSIEGYSHKEIAEALGITEGTSKSQLSKAKAYLQKMIQKEFTPHHE